MLSNCKCFSIRKSEHPFPSSSNRYNILNFITPLLISDPTYEDPVEIQRKLERLNQLMTQDSWNPNDPNRRMFLSQCKSNFKVSLANPKGYFELWAGISIIRLHFAFGQYTVYMTRPMRPFWVVGSRNGIRDAYLAVINQSDMREHTDGKP